MTQQAAATFPKDFLWGAATSAYQVEGAAAEDGRGPSVWDEFKRIKTHENGAVACDQYHRWPADIKLMQSLGLQTYRFSIAWPRVQPQGSGPVNAPGLDYYERLIDGLLAAGIHPLPTLYHWDLPLPLQQAGGWPRRDTVQRYVDYAQIVVRRLGDRVADWTTLNEPWVHAMVGHLYGEHAPGKHSIFAGLAAMHHLLLAHGMAVPAIRAAAGRSVRVGIALNLTPVYPAHPGGWDDKSARFSDNFLNRLSLDPVLKGEYPPDFTASRIFGFLTRGLVQAGDMQTIKVPIDFMGINYYYRTVMRYMPVVRSVPVFPKTSEYTEMWEIYPDGLYDLLMRLKRDYPLPPVIITENGAAVADKLDADGHVHDPRRISFLRDHLAALRRAMADGVNVEGYCVWSLLDNFEWAQGYSKRFGLVYVDFATQARIPKDSANWYAQVIRQNGIGAATPSAA